MVASIATELLSESSIWLVDVCLFVLDSLNKSSCMTGLFLFVSFPQISFRFKSCSLISLYVKSTYYKSLKCKNWKCILHVVRLWNSWEKSSNVFNIAMLTAWYNIIMKNEFSKKWVKAKNVASVSHALWLSPVYCVCNEPL